MSIQEILAKFKRFFADADSFVALLLVLVATVSFGLGRLSAPSPVPDDGSVPAESKIRIEYPESAPLPAAALQTDLPPEEVSETGYVASKNGTKYHLPWCGGAQQIKEENKIWFASKDEAEAAGYTPAANCKGL